MIENSSVPAQASWDICSFKVRRDVCPICRDELIPERTKKRGKEVGIQAERVWVYSCGHCYHSMCIRGGDYDEDSMRTCVLCRQACEKVSLAKLCEIAKVCDEETLEFFEILNRIDYQSPDLNLSIESNVHHKL